MDRTRSSIFAMSVSSRMEDLAIRPGFLAFFSAYCRSLSSRTLAASWSSSSSSLPKRSMSLSSSSSAAAGAGFFAGEADGSSTFLEGTLNGSTFFSRVMDIQVCIKEKEEKIKLKLNQRLKSSSGAEFDTAQDTKHGPHRVIWVKDQLLAIRTGHATRWTFELAQHGHGCIPGVNPTHSQELILLLRAQGSIP
uniref:Uncharacterized protein n=1 Tax=Strigops habroptila TaxID=2489341 RepID=A0A672TJH5_STRHB